MLHKFILLEVGSLDRPQATWFCCFVPEFSVPLGSRNRGCGCQSHPQPRGCTSKLPEFLIRYQIPWGLSAFKEPDLGSWARPVAVVVGRSHLIRTPGLVDKAKRAWYANTSQQTVIHIYNCDPISGSPHCTRAQAFLGATQMYLQLCFLPFLPILACSLVVASCAL